jgi:hypothetical protein
MKTDDFQAHHKSTKGSLRFISKKRGIFQFGYEELSDAHFKISSTIQLEGDIKTLSKSLQNDLRNLQFYAGGDWRTGSLVWHDFVLSTFESLKKGCRIQLLILQDQISALLVIEFTLEPLEGNRIEPLYGIAIGTP